MMSVGFSALTGILVLMLAVAVPVAAVWLVVRVLNGLGWVLGGIGHLIGSVVRRIAGFVRGTVLDSLQLVGSVLTATVVAPLSLASVALGRWSAARHYGRALEDEFTRAGLCAYRLALGNPIRLLGLEAVTEGLERRLPDLIGGAPGPEPSRRRRASFEGYQVTGTLPAGGSGARLYLATPAPEKVSAFQAAGHPDPGQVVIKSFALEEGSTLPQIVRESRALECASKLGLVLEHALSPTSFHYVMPYVPGESLDAVTRRLHEQAGGAGLGDGELAQVAAYGVDLLGALDRFHAGGLWHKDIKPSNVIVSGHQAHLVDLGLVTPLASALTLTTHGTEYYRDPEMVRLAMQGVKVHEVDGVKFDIYSVGAVLYSLVENDFPAQGNLSRITRRCPDALKMIIRRAMSEMGTRYGSARAMLEDLRVVLRAEDPFRVPVAALPSMGGAASPSRGKVPPLPAYPASLSNLDREEGPAPGSWAARPAARRAAGSEGRQRRAPGHRIGRGLFLAAVSGLVLLVGLSGLAALFLTARHVHPAERQATVSVVRAHRDAGASRGPSIVVQHEGRPRLVATPPAPAPARGPWDRHLARLPELGQGTRVLVVPDPRLSLSREELGRLDSALGQRGARVLGLDRSSAESLEESAGARMAVGVLDPRDERARVGLQRFLDQEARDLDAVLWLAGDSESEAPFLYVRRSSSAAAVLR